MRIVWISALAMVLCGMSLRAENTADQDAGATRLRIKAAKLIGELGAEEFGTREAAEKSLIEMGAPVLPQVKEALADTKDTEARTRLDRVRKALALAGETDPDQLAKIAREEALGLRYDSAAKFYAKAADLYGKQAEAETDEAKKKDLTAKAEQSTKRKARAEGLTPSEAVAENGGRVIVRQQGGGNARVVIQVQGNGGKVQLLEAESEAGGDSDW